MKPSQRTSFVAMFAFCGLMGGQVARAAVPPQNCGLSAGTERSGAWIESCIDPGFQPSDVWIDGNYMYVSRGFDAGSPNSTRVRVYNISNPAAPAHVEYLDSSFPGPVGASVGGGNGMAYVANYCAAGCSTELVTAVGWDVCGASNPTSMIGDPAWPNEIADRGMHSLFLDAGEGFLYGANNGISADSFSVPAWDVGVGCSVADSLGSAAIPVGGLDEVDSHIHEVAAANNRLAVAAWTDVVLYDVSGGPSDSSPELGRVEGGAVVANDSCNYAVCNAHSAYPFASDKMWVTEERRGGRFMGFLLANGLMIAKGSTHIPPTKGASYHEIAHIDNNVHLSAYQAGMRTFRYVPDEGYYILGAYYDTSSEDCGALCPVGTSWPGSTGIAYGSETNNRRIVAVANTSDDANDRRVFLLSVFTPNDSNCDGGMTCTATTAAPAGNAPYPDLLIARSSDDSVTQVGKLVRYPGTGSGLGSPTSLSQTGLTAGHDYGYVAVTGDFNRDGRVDVAVGAPGQKVGTVASGRVYVYKRNSNGTYSLLQTIDQTGLGTNSAGERFGAALAAGDFDADGDDDLVVGAPVANEVSGVAAGAVFLFRGSTTGLSAWSTIANTTNASAADRFGATLAKGDFNGDGIADFVIGAPLARVGASSPYSGVFHIYKGMAGALPTYHSRKGQTGLDSDEGGDRFASWLVVGDWNNDNRDDVVVGAPGEEIGDISAGRLYAFLGSASTMLITWSAKDQTGLDTNEEQDLFGHRAVSGDFNNDGFDDVAVTAVGEEVSTGVRSGKVYVFRGSTSNLLAQVALDQAVLQTNNDIDGFGERLGAGDWNADGKLDLAVVAPGFPSGSATNPLYLFKGSATGPLAWQTLTVP